MDSEPKSKRAGRALDLPSHDVEWLLGALAKVPAHVAVLRGPAHEYAFVNEMLQTILGIDDPIGKPFGASGHTSGEALIPILDQVYRTGVAWSSPEVRVADSRALPNEARWFHVSFIPLRDESGAVDAILLHSFDVSELVRAREKATEKERELFHAQKLESLGVLAGGIAHDFNNMLTAVQGSVSVASLMLDPRSPAQSALQDALAAVRRAHELTRQLLAYSGKGRFSLRRLNLSRHVAELTRLLETTLPKKTRLVTSLAENLPAVLGDPAQVQQVAMNLVLNAGEAIDEGAGVVTVTTALASVDASLAARLTPQGLPLGPYVVLEVRDAGRGMDAATLARIFDPFFTTKFTGRGLGLAAVLGIVKGHHAGLLVESEPGAGTTFRVYFPASPGPVDEDEEAPESFRGHGLVLVIDDDAGVRTVVGRLLEELGFRALLAENARRGIEALAAHAAEVRVVLLDMTMPDLHGDEALAELRKVRADVPVVLSSGYSEAEVTQRFASGNLAGFLPKPFMPQELIRCLRVALAKPAGRRA